MKCQNCGAELKTGAQFCEMCGTKIQPVKRFCKNCGAELTEDMLFCSYCGTKVEIESQQAKEVVQVLRQIAEKASAQTVNVPEKSESANSSTGDTGPQKDAPLNEEINDRTNTVNDSIPVGQASYNPNYSGSVNSKKQNSSNDHKIRNLIFAVAACFIVIGIVLGGGNSKTSKESKASNDNEPRIEVLNVKGMTYLDALNVLQNAGFTNIRSNVKPETDKTLWVVTGQSVTPGNKIHAGDRISLVCGMQCKFYLDIASDINVFFNTYDIDISFDGKEIGSVSNGKEFTCLMDSLTGTHDLVFCKSGSTSPKASKTITLDGDTTYSCVLLHDSESISIKDAKTESGVANASLEVVDVTGMILADAMDTLTEIGFTNLREEPYGSIWDKENWIVTEQGLAAGTIADKREYIQLDCISLDDYFKNTYVGKNISEIEKLAKEKGISLRFEDSALKDLNEKVSGMDESAKTKWIATGARRYYAAERTAVVTIKQTGKASEESTKPENDEVLTIENCPELKALCSAKYVDPEKEQAFVEKYKGKIIEFDCLVLQMELEEGTTTIYDYILVPGKEKDSIGATLFFLDDISTIFGFKWDKATKPDYVYVGSKLRMRAEVGSLVDGMAISLYPVQTWGR